MNFKTEWDNWTPPTAKNDATADVITSSAANRTAKTAKSVVGAKNSHPHIESTWEAFRKVAEAGLEPAMKKGDVVFTSRDGSVPNSLHLLTAFERALLRFWLQQSASKLRDYEIAFLSGAFSHYRLSGPYQIYTGPDVWVCFESSLVIAPGIYSSKDLGKYFNYADESILYQEEILKTVTEPDAAYQVQLAKAIVLPARTLEGWFAHHLDTSKRPR